MKEFSSILIRMPNWLGDVVMATPVLKDVRTRFPQAKITVMCQHNVAPLLLGNPYIDEIFSFIKPQGFLHRIENRDVILRLQQGKYDLGILLTNSFSSAYLMFRGHVEKRIGFALNGRSLFLTDPLPHPPEKGQEHLVTTYKRLLKPLEIALSDTAPALFVTAEEKEQAQTLLKEQKLPPELTLIGFNPGAAFGPAKCWLPERFAQVAQEMLQDPKNAILFFGDKQSAPIVKGICEALPKELQCRALNLAGVTTLRQLIALIDRCDAILTNDSGPMHIAAALKKPLVALFGSTSDKATGPYGGGHVINKRVACAPCYKRVCPIDFRCMKSIHTDEVVAALKKALEK